MAKCINPKSIKKDRKEYFKKYRENHKDKMNKYREENKDKIKFINKKYREKNKDKIKDMKKRYQEENWDKIRKYKKRYHTKYRKHKKEYDIKYKSLNREKILKRKIEYNKKSKKNICIICGKKAKTKYCSKKCMGKGTSNEGHHNWQGGITPLHQKIRTSKEYKLWRISIFERDKYTCVLCGKVGGYLEAHHIKSFAEFPKLRLDVDNGITVCKDCHGDIDEHRKRFLKKLPKLIKVITSQ